MMMYGHCVSTNKMISYAPSFGQTDIQLLEKHNAKTIVAEGLKNFVDLSSRDENTKNIIEELTGRKATMVCDPVLLYDFSKTKINFDKIPKKKYLVVYAYDFNMTDEKEVEAIKKFAKKRNLITVSPGTYHKWCDLNISCNALEWVEVFKNAEYVITDTFHGTITAAITKRPISVLVRNKLNSNKMVDLLNKLGIENRRITEVTEEQLDKTYSEKYDGDAINENIDKLRKASNEYLINAIEKCSK